MNRACVSARLPPAAQPGPRRPSAGKPAFRPRRALSRAPGKTYNASVRGAVITIRCDCGGVGYVPYDARWECPTCHRRWNTNQIPAHTHPALCNSNNGTQSTPLQNFWSASAVQLYVDPANAAPMAMAPQNVGSAGGSQPHENMGPFLVISFILSLFGVFPHQ